MKGLKSNPLPFVSQVCHTSQKLHNTCFSGLRSPLREPGTVSLSVRPPVVSARAGSAVKTPPPRERRAAAVWGRRSPAPSPAAAGSFSPSASPGPESSVTQWSFKTWKYVSSDNLSLHEIIMRKCREHYISLSTYTQLCKYDIYRHLGFLFVILNRVPSDFRYKGINSPPEVWLCQSLNDCVDVFQPSLCPLDFSSAADSLSSVSRSPSPLTLSCCF